MGPVDAALGALAEFQVETGAPACGVTVELPAGLLLANPVPGLFQAEVGVFDAV